VRARVATAARIADGRARARPNAFRLSPWKMHRRRHSGSRAPRATCQRAEAVPARGRTKNKL